MSALEFTILGCGSSGGSPRADGNWGACDPSEPKNLRTRCSLLVRRTGPAEPGAWTTVLVDTAPDLRLQTAAAGVKRVDAVLFTHDHADQTHGIDDLRAFYLRHGVRIPCHMDEATSLQLHARFGYVFRSQGGYPAICEAVDLPAYGRPFAIDGPSGSIPVVGFDQDHGEIRSVGFRFGDVAYSSDVVGFPEASFEALKGLDTWIVDALRDTPHPTHAHVAMTLEWIARVKPRRAILTNLHIDLDYATLRRRLPPGVEPAYDQMRFVVEAPG
ncbi:MAG TPA: MBL fold metallo-hydrolase [Caulobacteraceae bacterium]|jgi:phosphoribosyl 1,2-cyclic phosphate phosphodiesterase|nr:MBL fold metallo-hydrolase [Caulobacteraceae bacterium]